MFRLLLVACLFVSGICYADDDYIRVTGRGKTESEAKSDAFHEAVQLKIGAIVLSEQESSLNSLDKNDVSVYSAGYVTDYKIISTSVVHDSVIITMDVLVNPSKLLNQTLSRGGKTQDYMEGYKIGDSVATYRAQKFEAYKMLAVVLRTYPEKAYTIKIKPYSIGVDKFQNVILEVPYTLKWNYDFLASLNEAMKAVEDNKFGWFEKAPANAVIMAKDPKDFLIGSRNHYEYNDMSMISQIKYFMSKGREVSLLLTLRDGNNTKLYNSCWIPASLIGRKSSFYDLGEPNSIAIFGNQSETDVLRARIDMKHEWILRKITSMEVSVVPRSSCPA